MKKLVIVLTVFVAVNLIASAQFSQDKISIEKDSNGIVMWAIFPLNADRTQVPIHR